LENFTRTLLVAFTIVFTIALDKKINKFVGVLGSISCTPVAFSWPSLFHYKLVAKTKV